MAQLRAQLGIIRLQLPGRSAWWHRVAGALALLSASCVTSPGEGVVAQRDAKGRPNLMAAAARPGSKLPGIPTPRARATKPRGTARKPSPTRLTGGYVLTHEHPTNAMAFGGNYAFAGKAGNFHHGIMDRGYTASCGGCKPGKKCDHAEVKGNFTAALGAMGSDMGDHGSYVGPRHDSFSHVRYSTEWIEAAARPGDGKPKLEIMVAFAVESEAMCEELYYANKGNGGPGGDGYPCSHGDTKASIDRQLDALKAWAKDNDDWMEIAYKAADVRRIVGAGKLAVILGVESDYAFGAEDRTFDPVTRLKHYYDEGVRSFYLAHKVNSRLAGADVYHSGSTKGGKAIRATQAFAGCFYVDDSVAEFPLQNGSGHRFCDNTCGKGGFKGGKATDKCVKKYSDVSEANTADYTLVHGDDWFNGFAVYPKPPGFSGSAGTTVDKHTGIEHNNLGLSYDGERVVRAAMRRGMIITLDHTSSRTRSDIAVISKDFGDYPMNALHNNPNAMLVANNTSKLETPGPNEYDFDDDELALISNSGGFFGLRLGPVDAANYPKSGVTTNCPKTATETAQILAYLLDKHLNVGYSLDFATVTQAVHSRTFESCGRSLGGGSDPLNEYGSHVTEGLSHVGMMKYWHDELAAVGLKRKYLDKLENDGPEAFVQMWERAEAKSTVGKQIPHKSFPTYPPPDQCVSNSDCASSEYCGDPVVGLRTCKAKRSKGEACMHKYQCSSNRCSWGKCK